jgi:exosome complex RNA-binding protein Csl4
MLVVVDVVPRVAMVPVDVVEVVLVRHRNVPAVIPVDVHVARVRDVLARDVHDPVRVVDVVLVDVVDVPVVQEVDVVLVRHRGMPAVAVVDVRVLRKRVVNGGVGHLNLRTPR